MPRPASLLGSLALLLEARGSLRGHSGRNTSWPRALKNCSKFSQLRGVSHAPWMRTIGLAISIPPRCYRMSLRLRRRVGEAAACNTFSSSGAPEAAQPRPAERDRPGRGPRHGFGYVVDGRKAGDPGNGTNRAGRHLREMLDDSDRRSWSNGARRGRTSCRRTSSRSCAACRTTCARSRSPTSRRRFAKSSASRSSVSSPSSTRSRSRRRRSGRCIVRRCRTGGSSPSRCSGRTRRARSRPTSR